MDDIILSQDGSHTILSQKFGVSYHSKYGAIQETQTVFIDAGLKYIEAKGQKDISILEMGFGTGLNALMTLLQLNPKNSIDYHTIEAYPLVEDQYLQLNYPEILALDKATKEAFISMHSSQSGSLNKLSDQFTFTKYLQKIEDFITDKKFDIIYYDAFAPTSQEELWTLEMMSKLSNMCNPGAVLVTYCAKGSFKRTLKGAGFTIEAINGPIGKREMTRAHKPTLIG
jgi:tRNA U34 5-methylaminomethyl-2-thiouridine-forming methyltransferase MnmC